MIAINAVDYTKACSDPREAGARFYSFLKDNFVKGESFEINMAQAVMPSLFLNTSFYPLIAEFGAEKVKEKVRFINMSRQVYTVIKKYFEAYASDREG